jgi:hypothetical protein
MLGEDPTESIIWLIKERAGGSGDLELLTTIIIDVVKGALDHGWRPGRPRVRVGKRFEILKRDSFTCSYCGRSAPKVELEVDHVVPRARGGSDEYSNLTTACTDCNRGKSDSSL